MFKEFKEFISRGNVIDLAIAVIMGSAFKEIINTLVDNILMPAIGVLMAGFDFSKYSINFAGTELGIGLFINAIINFLIVSFVMFLIIKTFNNMKKKEKEAEPSTKECPHCKSQIHIDATRCPNCTSELIENLG